MGENDPTPADLPEDDKLWQQADRVFDHLLDLPESERASHLADLPLPPAVRRLVQRLLGAETSPGPLDRSQDWLAAFDADDGSQNMLGRRVGDWTLGAELGRGGMAVVFEAERRIAGAVQPGALKLVTVGALAANGRQRFEREQGILARLEHPGIIGLLDAGVLEDGTPWMVMPRVQGVHIDRWCQQQQLGVRATVRLFLQVCDAVEFAHRNLVIHRDIKPSNVLVDASGAVRLLDFGIAHLLDEQADGHTRTRAVTPGYAAPEQQAGANPSTGMDVFGLGALLFRLLTLATPPPLHGDEAPLASSVCLKAGHAERAHKLRGDLDALLARAMAPDPSARYASVAALVSDAQHWLDGLPLRARRAGRLYRVRKFIGRHRLAVAATTLGLIAVLGATALAFHQADVAAHQAQRAEAARDFLVDLFKASDPDVAAGTDLPASELLRRGAAEVGKRFAAQPALRAELLGTIGIIQHSRGLLDDAQASLDQAIALYRGLDSGSTARVRVLSARGGLYYDRYQMPQALQSFAQALDLARAQGIAPWSPDVLAIEVRAALVETESGAPQAAIARLKRVRELMRAHGLSSSYSFAHSSQILAAALARSGHQDEAIRLLQQTLSATEAFAAHPTMRCDLLNDLGMALYEAKRLVEAVATADDAVSCNRKYYGLHTQPTLYAMSNHAWVLKALGRNTQAAAAYDDVLALTREFAGSEPSPDLAYTLAMAALARDDAGRDDSLAAMREALAIVDRLSPAQATELEFMKPIHGLLLFERGLPGDLALLERDAEACRNLAEASTTNQRICLAWMLRRGDAGECVQRLPESVPPSLTSTAQRPWLAAYHLLRQRCAGSAEARQAAEAGLRQAVAQLDHVPAWLAGRLPEAVADP